MTIEEKKNMYDQKYRIMIGFDLNATKNYKTGSQDYRKIRYTIKFPMLLTDADGNLDYSLKSPFFKEFSNVKGADITSTINMVFRHHPEYMKDLEETVERKTREWEEKKAREGKNG